MLLAKIFQDYLWIGRKFFEVYLTLNFDSFLLNKLVFNLIIVFNFKK